MQVEWSKTGVVFPSGLTHWSRRFEYPWVIENSNFQAGEWVLDAAGGDGPLQIVASNIGCKVVNVDIEPKTFPKESKATFLQGDLRKLAFADSIFTKIICVSVLEHIEQPLVVIKELWRVLAPGGRLVVTMDVADYIRWNHNIDLSVATDILKFFGLEIPIEPLNIIRFAFAEENRKPDEPEEVILKVLCFYADKSTV